MSVSEKTYKIIIPPEQAMPWQSYESKVLKEWNTLLSAANCEESVFQSFFEKHPCFLPMPHTVFLGSGHHGLFPSAVISQPTLAGLSSKRPDFLMIGRDSESVYAIMIEIESPCKKWFTKRGHPTSDLTLAINQLKDWQVWFKDPLNAEQFKRDYRISDELLRFRSFEQRYLLIYGRRKEVESSPNNK